MKWSRDVEIFRQQTGARRLLRFRPLRSRMPTKKRQKLDHNTFQFDLQDLFTTAPSQTPQFSVESISADGRRIHKEVHLAEPPSPLKTAAASRPPLASQENASNDADPWSTYDFGLEGPVFQVPAAKKKKRYQTSVGL